MTKAELREKIIEFVKKQDDEGEDDWYATDRKIYGAVLMKFAEDYGIPLTKEDLL